ncbi:MAG: LLM class flavin-dependent oxidoreductase [Chloroflexota bacterium]
MSSAGSTRFGIFDILQVNPNRPTHESIHEHLDQLELADQLGFDYIFVAERHFMPHYRATSPGLLLAALARNTTNARLGVLAYTLAAHHPALLAEEVSMLDHLTRGRLEFGIGLGHRPSEIAGLGYPVEGRQGIFIENLVVMRQAWDAQVFDFTGNLRKLENIWVPKPYQDPHPPIWFAGGDPRITAWAARNGLRLAVGFKRDEDLIETVESYRAEEPPAEAPPRHIALMRHVYVAESDEQAREEIINDLMGLGELMFSQPQGGSADEPKGLSREEATAQFERQREQQVLVSGGPDTVAEAIAGSLGRLGADTFLANVHLTGVEHERIRRTMNLFANEVRPRIERHVGDS